MSGINGPCNRDCQLGRPHDIDCHNYIELGPCVVCNELYGRHLDDCILSRKVKK